MSDSLIPFRAKRPSNKALAKEEAVYIHVSIHVVERVFFPSRVFMIDRDVFFPVEPKKGPYEKALSVLQHLRGEMVAGERLL